MAKKKPNEKKPIVDEAELKKQNELKKQIEEQRIREEQEERERIEKEKGSLLGSIVEQAEARTPKQKKAKNLDDELLKTKLVGGGTVKQEIDKIAQYRQPYIPYFSYNRNTFYKDTYKLKLKYSPGFGQEARSSKVEQVVKRRKSRQSFLFF